MDPKSITFCLSKDIPLPIKVKVHSLTGTTPPIPKSSLLSHPLNHQKLSNINAVSDLYITVQIYTNGNPITETVTTSYTSFNKERVWDQWLTLPINYNQISINSIIKFRVYEIVSDSHSLFGFGELSLFDEYCCLAKGRYVLKLSQHEHNNDNSTPNDNEKIRKNLKMYENGDIPKLDWLDDLLFSKLNKLEKSHQDGYELIIEFWKFDINVIYSDVKYSAPKLPVFIDTNGNTNGNDNSNQIIDYDQYRDDAIEIKYRKLERNYKEGPLDRELKPTPKIRDELHKIINYSSNVKLSNFEKNLIWKFRYYLTKYKKSLTKFLKSINWDNLGEVTKVIEILPYWVEIDIDDSIELLSKNFTQVFIREYAVKRLTIANDDELLLYLLQLVQALNYEVVTIDNNEEFEIIEIHDEVRELSPLAVFLIDRCCKSPVLSSFLYWFLKVEIDDDNSHNKLIYVNILSKFMDKLKLQENGKLTELLSREITLIDKLTKIYQAIKLLKNETTVSKIETLKSYLSSDKFNLLHFSATPLPIDPTVHVIGCIPEQSTVFKSSLAPIKITFKTTNPGQNYSIMFKIGDDLRQDQLIIQIINLMDNLLQNENLDLKLTPYKILATSPKAGALQFIPNQTLSSVLLNYTGILQFLQHHNPDPTEEYGVSKAVMENYVKSCAGYCVITYLLGVGDRHLDNLLICHDGKFFHADFGYILGQDPKPFPPLMKLPIQIVEGMGGLNSSNFIEFQNYCFICYNTLRKNSNLILNLFELMIDANIPDIKIDPQGSVLKVQEKFCLGMSEEEATIHFRNLINDSVNAFLPVVIDRLHSLAQYWRA